MAIDSWASLETCFQVSTIAIALWGIISAAEWMANLRIFRPTGLLTWSILGLRGSPVNRSRLAEGLASPTGVSCFLGVRLVAASALIFSPTPVVSASLLAIILVTCAYVTHRTCFGGDGSDQMGAVLGAGTFLMGLGIVFHDRALSHSGVFLIAGQASISYFVAGAAKLVSSTWRSGRALSGVMNTQTYGHAVAGHISIERPGFCALFCWTIILTEMAFPVLLVLPKDLLFFGLAGFALFHLSNAVFMGLNVFVIAFIGTYPAVIYANTLLRAALTNY